MGLGGLTVVLEEGEREQWFSSPEIRWLALVSAIGFVLLFAGQMRASRPVIRLRLLLDRQFGSIVAMVTVVGMVIYGTSYVIPQFLSIIAGYNSLQSGQIVLLSGVPMIMMMPFTPWLVQNVDIRIAVSFGLSLLALSAWLETDLTSLSTGGNFVASQLMRGVGTVFAMMFMNQAAIRSVPPAQAGDASGLYNAARNLGGSFALAGIAVIQDQRTWLHSRRIEETLSANSRARAGLHGRAEPVARRAGGGLSLARRHDPDAGADHDLRRSVLDPRGRHPDRHPPRPLPPAASQEREAGRRPLRSAMRPIPASLALAGPAGRLHRRPELCRPAAGRAHRPPAFARAAPEQSNATAPVARWWEALGDPVLNDLVARALTANPNIAVAEARLRQARAALRVEKGNELPSANAQALYAHAHLPGVNFNGNSTQ